MNFGYILKALIDEQDITQKELANALNVAPSTISSYVQNAREPDFATLKLIANYFDVSTDYLLSFKTEHSLTHKEEELLRVFRCLSDNEKDICIEQCRVFLKLHPTKN